MSIAISGFANRVARGKIAIAFCLVGLVVVCIPSPGAGQDAGQVKFVNSCKMGIHFTPVTTIGCGLEGRTK